MKKSLNSQIARLAFPAILSNITVPLMGLCDTAISGHFGSAVYTAAIASGTVMINVVFWLCGFLRMGTTGLTAEAYGAMALHRMKIIFSRSFFLGISIGTLVTLSSPLLCRLLLFLLNPEPKVASLTRDYYMICIFGAPAQLATMAITGWFVGMQDTLRPMVIAMATNILNIMASLTAVYVLNAGFEGIAYGTLIANWVGLLLALTLVFSFASKTLSSEKKRGIFVAANLIFKGGELSKFFSVSSELFFRSACIMTVSFTVTAIGARIGAVTLATNAIIMQFFIFFSYFMDGFAFCGEALCGKAMGMNDVRLFKNTIHSLYCWSAGMVIAATAIYAIGSQQIVSLLTDIADVREMAMTLYPWIIAIPAISVASFIFDGIYIGLTETRAMLLTTFSAMLVFIILSFMPQIVIEHKTILPTNRQLWTAFLTYLFVRGGILFVMLKGKISKHFKNSINQTLL